MSQTMEEEYKSNESESMISWIWSKTQSSWKKKVLKVGVVVALSPLLFPPLFVVSTIAFISSIPFCLFLATYAFTQKLMSTLLPKETGGTKTDESGLVDRRKLGHGSGTAGTYEAEPLMATNKRIIFKSEEDEELAKESTGLIERIRDEGRTERDDEKSGNDKSEKFQDQYGREGGL